MCAVNGVSFEPLRLWLLSSQTPYSHPVMGIALWRMTKGMLTGRRLLCQRHQPLALAEVRTNWYIGMMWYVVIGGRISCVRHEAEIGLTAVLTFTINGLFFMLKNKISSSSWISGVIQYNATRSKNIMRYTIFRRWFLVWNAYVCYCSTKLLCKSHFNSFYISFNNAKRYPISWAQQIAMISIYP